MFKRLYTAFEKKETDLFKLQNENQFSRFIIIRSLDKEHLIKIIKDELKQKISSVKVPDLYEQLFNSSISENEIISFINKEYPKVREERIKQEIHLPSIIENFGEVNCGIRNDNLNDTAKSLVRNKSILNRADLNKKIDDLLNTTIKNYILWQYYNQVTNDLIEHLFNDHKNIIPTLRKVKFFDFMIKVDNRIIPFDLKVTHISDDYYDLNEKGLMKIEDSKDDFAIGNNLSESEKIKKYYKKLKKEKELQNYGNLSKEEIIEILINKGLKGTPEMNSFFNDRKKAVEKIENNLRSLEWWNYKYQGERLFKNNNRFFIFLAYKKSFSDARPLKGNLKLIKEKVTKKLDNISKGDINEINYYYTKDKGLEGNYKVNSMSILVSD